MKLDSYETMIVKNVSICLHRKRNQTKKMPWCDYYRCERRRWFFFYFFVVVAICTLSHALFRCIYIFMSFHKIGFEMFVCSFYVRNISVEFMNWAILCVDIFIGHARTHQHTHQEIRTFIRQNVYLIQFVQLPHWNKHQTHSNQKERVKTKAVCCFGKIEWKKTKIYFRKLRQTRFRAPQIVVLCKHKQNWVCVSLAFNVEEIRNSTREWENRGKLRIEVE